MRSLVLRPLFDRAPFRSSPSTPPPVLLSRRCRADALLSYGLNSALAAKGVIVRHRAFRNLDPSELQRRGATIAESLCGLPVRFRGNVFGGASELPKPQFTKLLKQVTTHLSSISDVFVHDGAIGSSTKFNVKVRLISDCPSAILRLSSVLWKTHGRAVSHDPCALTVYVATTISPDVRDVISLGDEASNGFLAADIGRLSLILCGRAFTDINETKQGLMTLSGPIVSARGGLLLSARLLILGDSTLLLFAPEDTIQSCVDHLVSADAGVIVSSENVAPVFQTGNLSVPDVFKLPAAIILAASDSSGGIPSVSKLSPGQAAYHFLAGYENGKSLPGYTSGPLSIHPLDLAKGLFLKMEDHNIPSYLVNTNQGDQTVSGKDFLRLLESALSMSVPPFVPKGGDIQRIYSRILKSRYKDLPEKFSF